MYKKPLRPERPPLRSEVQASDRATEFARTLRKEMSPPERLLWSRLKGGRLAGLRFRKQHPLGPWIADFYCHEARLVVKVDGPSHAGDRRRIDGARDRWMTDRDLGVIRFTGSAIFRSLKSVLDTILWRAQDRQRALAPPPPLPAGEVAGALRRRRGE